MRTTDTLPFVTTETNHRRAVKAGLLEAALDLFARFGYSVISHADIAEAAGIGRTTFYEYFPSKEELLVQLVEERLPAYTASLLAETPTGVAADQRLTWLVARMIEFVATDHFGLLLHTEVPRLPDASQRRIGAAHAELAGAFVDLFVEGAGAGRFRDVPPELAARLVYDVVMTAGRTVMNHPEPKQQVHEVTDVAIDFLLYGLARPGR